MSEAKGILIVGETIEEKIAPITAELLGCGRKLADELGEPLFGALIGSDVSGIAQELIALGADTVYTADNPILQNYQTDTYTQVMEKMCKDISPRYVLMGQTTIWRDLSPRLAFRLNTGLSTDCVDLKIDPQGKGLLQTRPVYGGNAQAIFAVENKYPQIATIRSKAFSPLAPDTTRQGNVIPVAIEIDTSKVKTKFVRKVKEEVTGVKLEDAKAVVTGGRGIGGPDGFKQLEELAAILGGAVGATRPPCD
ncbi:MAG: electron transfer flavoprotein subunit alpha/FixB family protein, partial [Dehalococcoidia bacterium]|nr:electron transfer flavoprotein subunit alpha/FixB family protein [Dehalococcoidia bacterium]